LGDDAGELRAGFDDEDAGHERRAGEMAAQELFGGAESVLGAAVLAGVELNDAVDEAEFRAVREKGEGFFVGRHFFIGSTIV
jgi:hypothetical protein